MHQLPHEWEFKLTGNVDYNNASLEIIKHKLQLIALEHGLVYEQDDRGVREIASGTVTGGWQPKDERVLGE